MTTYTVINVTEHWGPKDPGEIDKGNVYEKNLQYSRTPIDLILFFQEAVQQTAIEYTQSGSLHGMQYFFESGKDLVTSRVIWIVIVFIAAIIGIVWSAQVTTNFLPMVLELTCRNMFILRLMMTGKIIQSWPLYTPLPSQYQR